MRVCPMFCMIFYNVSEMYCLDTQLHITHICLVINIVQTLSEWVHCYFDVLFDLMRTVLRSCASVKCYVTRCLPCSHVLIYSWFIFVALAFDKLQILLKTTDPVQIESRLQGNIHYNIKICPAQTTKDHDIIGSKHYNLVLWLLYILTLLISFSISCHVNCHGIWEGWLSSYGGRFRHSLWDY